MDAFVVAVEITCVRHIGILGRKHRGDAGQLRVWVGHAFPIMKAIVGEICPAADGRKTRQARVSAEIRTAIRRHARGVTSQGTIIRPPIHQGMPTAVADAARRKQCVRQWTQECEVVVRIARDTAYLDGLETEERHLALTSGVEDVGPIPGFGEQREVLAQAAGRGVGQEPFGIQADVMEAGLRQRRRRRVLERVGQARTIRRRRQQRQGWRRDRLIGRQGHGVSDKRGITDGFEIRCAKGLGTLRPLQVIGTGRRRGDVGDDEAYLLVLATDPPTEIPLGVIDRRRGGLTIDEGNRGRMDLPDGLGVRRRADERDGAGGRHDRRRSGRLQGRAARQGEAGVSVTHLA